MTSLESIQQSLDKLFKLEKAFHDKYLSSTDQEDYRDLMCSINLLCIVKTYLENNISWNEAMYKTDYYCTNMIASQREQDCRNSKGELVRSFSIGYELGEVEKIDFDTFKKVYVREGT